MGLYCFLCGRHDPREQYCGCDLKLSALTSLYALCWYEGEWRRVLHRLKYRNQVFLAYPLGRALAFSLLSLPDRGQADLIVPVPLYPARERERGYNQSYLLARQVSRDLKVPLFKALKRRRETMSQTRLSRKERKENVKGAFMINNKYSLEGKKVLLIDDIFTTGATMREAAGMLRKAGAVEVKGAVAAVQRFSG